GRESSHRWDGAMHRRARVHYWVAEADVGAHASVSIDGVPRGTFVARATHGFWELPPLAEGLHRVLAESRAGTLKLYIDRPPALLRDPQAAAEGHAARGDLRAMARRAARCARARGGERRPAAPCRGGGRDGCDPGGSRRAAARRRARHAWQAGALHRPAERQ